MLKSVDFWFTGHREWCGGREGVILRFIANKKTHPHGLAYCILYSIHNSIYLIINCIYLFPKLVIVCVGTLVFFYFVFDEVCI